MAFDQSQASSAVRTLWVGELDSWMDETQLPLMFVSEQHNITNIKVIRDRVTQQPSGFGFVEFVSREAAEHALNTLNNQPLPIYPAKKFRLQWAQYGMVGRPESQLHSVYVGDLDHQVTDSMLESTFRARFPSVATARVVTEAGTGKPKGFGFVRFIDEAECKRAVNEMNNVPLCGRPMRVGLATPKPAKEEAPAPSAAKPAWPAPTEDGADGFNTTVFVGNLSPSVTQEILRSEFEIYGELESVNVPKGKNCGFVTFRAHEHAELALRMLQGKSIGGSSVRLSWGKSAALKRQAQMMPTAPYAFGMYPSYPYADYYNTAAPPMYPYPPAPVPQMMPPMAPAIPVQHPAMPHLPAMPLAAPITFGAQWIAQVDQVPFVQTDPLKLDVRGSNARFIRQHSYAVVLPFADSVHFQEMVKRSLAQ